MKNKLTYREALKEWNSEIMGSKIYGIPRKGYTPYFQVQDLKKTGKIEHYDPKPIRFMETHAKPEKPIDHKVVGSIPTAMMPKEIATTVATVRKRPPIAKEPEPVKPKRVIKRPTIAKEPESESESDLDNQPILQGVPERIKEYERTHKVSNKDLQNLLYTIYENGSIPTKKWFEMPMKDRKHHSHKTHIAVHSLSDDYPTVLSLIGIKPIKDRIHQGSYFKLQNLNASGIYKKYSKK
jgi:hypothetical protein